MYSLAALAAGLHWTICVRPPIDPSQAVRLLRYRFDSADQVTRHFHVATGRVLLFYPSLATLRPGEPVILDVAFTLSDQHCPVRGTVIGRDNEMQHVGSWLEFSAYGLVSSLNGATTNPRRRLRRFPTCTVVNVERGERMPVVGKLVDVSMGGGRLSGLSYKVSAGDVVTLNLFSSARSLAARVLWMRGPEAGIQFIKPTSVERAAVAQLVEAAADRFVNADEARHPSACRCQEGYSVIEPPLPRAAHRRSVAE
jgi:PilZ domain-containing protein